MTPITWLSCLAVLWTIVVDTQADEVQPLVMAVYSKIYDERPITFADLEDMKDENLKLPLDAAEPEYFVILCGSTKTDFREYGYLMVQLVTKKIDEEAQKIRCADHQLPSKRITSTTRVSFHAYTGYHFDMALWKQNNPNFERDELLNAFYTEFKDRTYPYVIKYFSIEYNYKYNIPQLIEHTVKAHMHSDTHEEKCEKITFNTFTDARGEDYTLDTLHNTQVTDYQWRQFVPMQDFKGTYATKATCIYPNYLLLHEEAIKSLKTIEIFIREIADVINEVQVESGTYTPEKEVSLKGDKPNQTIIPSTVWKKITYRASETDYYTILVVIHNAETRRICNHNEYTENLGLPGYDDDKENKIGDMYYCVVNNIIKNTLQILSTRDGKPLSLKNPPFAKDDKTNEINDTSKIYENKQAT